MGAKSISTESSRMVRRGLTNETSLVHSQAADSYDTGLQKRIPRYGQVLQFRWFLCLDVGETLMYFLQ